MIRHATEEPKPLQSVNSAIPAGLSEAIARMMAKEPAQRYAEPRAAAEALQPYLPAETDEPGESELNPCLRAYLTWLESKVVHADLPTWLAEMDTVRQGELQKVRSQVVEAPPVAPSRLLRPVAAPDAANPSAEKTTVVRRIRPIGRPKSTVVRAAPIRPVPPPTAVPPPPAVREVSPTEYLTESPQTSTDSVLEAPPPGLSRRELVAGAVGVGIGAGLTLLTMLISQSFGGEPTRLDLPERTRIRSPGTKP
jgi:hypothetical protein